MCVPGPVGISIAGTLASPDLPNQSCIVTGAPGGVCAAQAEEVWPTERACQAEGGVRAKVLKLALGCVLEEQGGGARLKGSWQGGGERSRGAGS